MRLPCVPAARMQAHYDYFHDSLNVQNGGQRVATVLMYLYVTSVHCVLPCLPDFSMYATRSDVEEGGETTFPSAAAGKRAASGA